MINILLLLFAVSTSDISYMMQEKKGEINEGNLISSLMPIISLEPSLSEVNALHEQANTLNIPVINKVLTALNCAHSLKVEHNNILVVIDYSLPSSEKRLWIFDLKEKKLLFNTYVSHGITSGTLFTDNFSNKFDSKASSIGVYKTEKAYYGREGLSLRLDGLDRNFNDNASGRSIVMHGGWYVDEQFIKKYGRPGRSWGCPAVPKDLSGAIINTIKENSIFVVYYPSDEWLLKSKFLHCDKTNTTVNMEGLHTEIKPAGLTHAERDDILFVDLKNNNQREESDPVVVMAADNYEQVFHSKAPLDRMLRRQINHMEYIALSNSEFSTIAINTPGGSSDAARDILNKVYFVIPEVTMVRGYYETQMKIVNLGKIKTVKLNTDSSKNIEQKNSYIVYLDSRPFVNLKSTNRFIRWLGL